MKKVVIGYSFRFRNFIQLILLLVIAAIFSIFFTTLLYFIPFLLMFNFYIFYIRKYSSIIIVNYKVYIKPFFREELIFPINSIKSISKTNLSSSNQYILELNDGDKYYFQGSYLKGISDLFIAKGDSLTDNYLNGLVTDLKLKSNKTNFGI